MDRELAAGESDCRGRYKKAGAAAPSMRAPLRLRGREISSRESASPDAAGQCILKPPQTETDCPGVAPLKSLAKNTASSATSSGSTILFIAPPATARALKSST